MASGLYPRVVVGFALAAISVGHSPPVKAQSPSRAIANEIGETSRNLMSKQRTVLNICETLPAAAERDCSDFTGMVSIIIDSLQTLGDFVSAREFTSETNRAVFTERYVARRVDSAQRLLPAQLRVLNYSLSRVNNYRLQAVASEVMQVLDGYPALLGRVAASR